MGKLFRLRMLMIVAVLALAFYWFGRPLAAIVNGDVILDYETQLTVPHDLAHVDAHVNVWNGALKQLEILGLGSPCADCIEVDPLPLPIPPLRSRKIAIHLPLANVPRGKNLPLEFRLLCDRPVTTTAFKISLYREPLPVDDRVPTPARPKAMPTPASDSAASEGN